jgi:predicted ATPase
VSLYRIVRASGAGRRSGARAPTPFIGREEELGLLLRRWERARAGDGQLALIVGEAGLGKSRLLDEFHARLGETPHTWIEWRASQLLQNTLLHPIAEWGRQRFGWADVPSARADGIPRMAMADAEAHAGLAEIWPQAGDEGDATVEAPAHSPRYPKATPSFGIYGYML